ncbi:MAG: FAD-dependent oxidoreductase [Acetobacteraceae bacterium]
MLATPLGPLTLRWQGLPAMAPWLARFAAAARPPRVAAGTAALAGLLATALADWQAELGQSGLLAMLRQEGALNVMETPAGAAAAAAEGRILAAYGIPFQDLSAAEVMERLPGLAVRPTAGRLFAQAAHVVNPFQLVQALAERFVADGGALVAAPVTGFRREGGRIVAVATPGGEHAADTVVLTAGLASAALSRSLGVALPITAERGYHAMLPVGTLPVPLPTTFNERGFVVTPMAHGMRLAGTVELGAAGRPRIGHAPTSWPPCEPPVRPPGRADGPLAGRPAHPARLRPGDRPGAGHAEPGDRRRAPASRPDPGRHDGADRRRHHRRAPSRHRPAPFRPRALRAPGCMRSLP